MTRQSDVSAGDTNCGPIGTGSKKWRQPDPQIAVRLTAERGAARRILNVVAGAGSYEATGRDVTPVEPSATMRGQDHEVAAMMNSLFSITK